MNSTIKDFETVVDKAIHAGIRIEIQALRCCDCKDWVGRCTQGKINKIASSPACEEATPR